ncbi:MAG: hypothetical protein Q4C67_01505, partial [Deinococcus sp.]|nr:hypothetical protein [Deinococcus sp.]
MQAKVTMMTMLLGFASAALAQQATAAGATPQATMQQFCRDLSQKDWKVALGNMMGLQERTVNQLMTTLIDDAATAQTMDQIMRKSRCEVTGGQGNQVRLRVSGTDALLMAEGMINDGAFLQVMLANMQGKASDAVLESAAAEAMLRQYQSGNVPPLTQTVNIEMERMGRRWIPSDDSMDVLMDGLLGGLSRL